MLDRRTFFKHAGQSLAAMPALWPSSGNAAPQKPLIWDIHFHLTSWLGETPEDRMK